MLDECNDALTPFRNAAERALLEHQMRKRALSLPIAQNDDMMAASEAVALIKAVRALPRQHRQLLTCLIEHLGVSR